MRLYFLAVLLLSSTSLAAQSITGSIVGTVKDASGLAVAGAEVTLVHAATGAGRQAPSDDRGQFVFSSLQPGEYTLTVRLPGFNTVEKRGIRLSAAETLSAGELVLQVGAAAETVTVTAQGAAVQTASAERAGVITSSQVEDLLNRSRTVTSLLQLLPGVVDLQENESIERNWNLYVQGNRRNTNNVQLDGTTLNAIGNNFN